MPYARQFGHFAVVSSTAANPKWFTRSGKPLIGVKRLAMLEVYPELIITDEDGYCNITIDTRLNCVKQIVCKSRKFYTATHEKDFYAHRRVWQEWCDLAEKFERLWPCHSLAKGWPWPDLTEMG